MKHRANTMNNFEIWYQEMQTMINNTPGVHYIGLVDHHTIATAYADHGFSLYPTHFSETGCISMVS